MGPPRILSYALVSWKRSDCCFYSSICFIMLCLKRRIEWRQFAGDSIDFSVYVNRTHQTNCKNTEKNVTSVVGACPEAHTISILDLMKQRNVPLERVCLLDPKAPKPLSPQDGEGEFDWFLFGVRINTPQDSCTDSILGHPRLATSSGSRGDND